MIFVFQWQTSFLLFYQIIQNQMKIICKIFTDVEFFQQDTIITNFSLESVARCLFFSFLSPPSSLLSYSFSINGSYFRKLKIYQFLNSILKDSDSISLWCEGLQNVFVSKSLNFSSLNILHGEWRTLHQISTNSFPLKKGKLCPNFLINSKIKLFDIVTAVHMSLCIRRSTSVRHNKNIISRVDENTIKEK